MRLLARLPTLPLIRAAALLASTAHVLREAEERIRCELHRRKRLDDLVSFLRAEAMAMHQCGVNAPGTGGTWN